MKIDFVYNLTEATVTQRWAKLGVATPRTQTYTVDADALKPRTRKLMLELGFKPDSKDNQVFDMKWKRVTALFGGIGSYNYSDHIELREEIASERDLVAALKLLKGMREADEFDRAKAKFDKERENRERAEREAQVAAAREQRRLEREAEDKAADAERTEWIAEHGSDHLKLLWTQRTRWDSALEMYERERAAIEYPGAYVDVRSQVETNRVEVPSAQALRYFLNGLTEEVRERSLIEWAYDVPSDDPKALDLIDHEVIMVNDDHYTFRLYVKVSDAVQDNHQTSA